MTNHIKQSQKFNAEHRIPPAEKIQWGYMDGGRGMRFNHDGTPAVAASREIITVQSPNQDSVLAQVLAKAEHETSHMSGVKDKVHFIARYVDDLLKINHPHQSEDILASISPNGCSDGVEMSLGDIIGARTGTCRHRSLLFKVMADHVGVKTSLMRGHYQDENVAGPHAWNEVVLDNGKPIIVDVMQRKIIETSNPLANAYHTLEKEKLYDRNRDTMLRDEANEHTSQAPDLQEWMIVKSGSTVHLYFVLDDKSPEKQQAMRGFLEEQQISPIEKQAL